MFQIHVFIKSIDCILLSSFEIKRILLISSVKTLYLSLLNLCCVFNINWLFFYEFDMVFFETIHVNFIFSYIIYFIIKLSCLKKLFAFFKFIFSFYDTPFFAFFFFILTTAIYEVNLSFLLLSQNILSLFSHLVHLSLIQLLFYFFLDNGLSNSKFEVSNLVSTSFAISW